jgi:UDPglucose 6-dehydrogenase/GDP-mannose 6-dehydrogenase
VPGTTDGTVLTCLETASGKRAGPDFGLGMNPEFLTEGQAIQDFLMPDRIVLGGIDERSIDAQAQLYSVFDAPVLRTNTRTAEMIKYASNAMLATAISFSNEIANLCSALGDIDVTEVMTGVHLSTYLSPALPDGQRVTAPLAAFFQAGCGYGGSCLPKDTKAIVAHGRGLGEEMSIINAVIRTNFQQPARTVALLDRHFSSLEGVRVAILGLAFKPDTDDVRETPALPIVQALLARGARVSIYDPVAGTAAARLFPDHAIDVRDSLRAAAEDVDALILVTRWDEFKELPDILHQTGKSPIVIDGRRMLDRHAVARYEGIGWRPLDAVSVSIGA